MVQGENQVLQVVLLVSERTLHMYISKYRHVHDDEEEDGG